MSYLHITLLFVSGRLDFSKPASLLVDGRQGPRRAVAAPRRPFAAPRAATLWPVRARPRDVQLAGRDSRTYGPRYLHLVLHDVHLRSPNGQLVTLENTSQPAAVYCNTGALCHPTPITCHVDTHIVRPSVHYSCALYCISTNRSGVADIQ